MTDVPTLPPLNGEPAGRPVAAGDAMTVLQCVSIGPENRAVSRSFGVRTALPTISVDGRMQLEDLAAALSEWNNAPDLPFAMLMRLPEVDAAWIMLRGAFVGAVATGNISILHGVLVPNAVMHALGNRAHRLLPAIPLPVAEPWQASTVQVDIGALAQQPARMIEGMPRWLLRHPPCPAVGIANTSTKEMDLMAALDTLGLDMITPAPEWITTKRLIAIGRFSPARFEIALPISAQRGDLADIFIANGRAELRSPLSNASIDDAWGMLFTGDAKADRRQGEMWQSHFADLAIEDAIAGTLKGLFPASGQTNEFFDILSIYAQRIAAMPPALAAQASGGFAILFDALNGDHQQTAQALNLWVEKVWPNLPGMDMQPFDAALDKNVLGAISIDNIMAICSRIGREQVDLAAQKLRLWLDSKSAQAPAHPPHLIPTLIEIAQHWARTYPESIAAHALALDLFTSNIPANSAHHQPVFNTALPGDDALIASADALLFAPSPLPVGQRVIRVMPTYLTLLSRSPRAEDQQKLLDVVQQARAACRPGSGMTLAGGMMSDQNLRNLCVMHYFTQGMGGAGHD